jgi:hypothetical protein
LSDECLAKKKLLFICGSMSFAETQQNKQDAEKTSQLQFVVRNILNGQDLVQRRQQNISLLKNMVKNPDNEMLIKKSFDRLLPTLDQLLSDR